MNSYLSFLGTGWTKERRQLLRPRLVDEHSQGNFGITVCIIVDKIQTVVAQEGGIGVHLLHSYLDGGAQPEGAEGEGHVPGSLEADHQLVGMRCIGGGG